MGQPDFEDFILSGGWDLLFPDDEDETCECPHCGRVIDGDEKVEWVDKKNKAFKCPDCGEEIELE